MGGDLGMKDTLEVKIECDMSDLDAAQVKADKLLKTLEKANSLADELTVLNPNFPVVVAEKSSNQKRQFSYSVKEIISEELLVFILGIAAGCMLFQLGTDLLKWLAI